MNRTTPASATHDRHSVLELLLHKEMSDVPSWVVQLFLPAFLCVGILSLLPRPGPTRVMIGLTAFSTMWWYAASRWAGDGSFMMGPMFAFPITLRWAFMVLRGTPELDCVQLQTTQAGKKTPVQLGLLQKLKWSMDLWCSWRGIGWNWEIQNIRKPANSSPSRLWVFPPLQRPHQTSTTS